MYIHVEGQTAASQAFLLKEVAANLFSLMLAMNGGSGDGGKTLAPPERASFRASFEIEASPSRHPSTTLPRHPASIFMAPLWRHGTIALRAPPK